MARRTQTYAIGLAVEGGGQIKGELVDKPPKACSDRYSAFCPLRGEPEGTCADSIANAAVKRQLWVTRPEVQVR
jgi:hypothetical protein